jgi:stearoyl-CoA desaturase (delta-9 desaturase)
MVVGPPILAAALAGIVWPHRHPGWPEVVAFIAMYLAGTIGIGAGYHRLVTHKAAKVPPWVAVVFAALGSTAGQGPITYWVALHRMHHANSDAPNDPHSPHAGYDGRPFAGFWHAHIGWMFTHAVPSPARWAPEILKNPALSWASRTYAAWFVAGQIVPAVFVGLLTHSVWGFWSGLLWGGLVRAILVQHVIWSINSVCHVVGARPYPSQDDSRNVWWLALPSCGEAWHNNHHAQPTSAVHGWDRAQIDVSGFVIRGLARLGLATDVKRPTERTLWRLRAEKRQADGDLPGAVAALERALALALAEGQRLAAVDIVRAALDLAPERTDLLARLGPDGAEAEETQERPLEALLASSPANESPVATSVPLTSTEVHLPEETEEEETAAAVLARLPIAGVLAETGALPGLLAAAGRVRIRPGEALFRKGDPADGIYVITEGTVRVALPDAVFIGMGQVVGESCVLDGEPRTADVVAETHVRALRVDRDALLRLCRAFPGLGARVLDLVIRRRLANYLKSAFPRETDEERAAIGAATRVTLVPRGQVVPPGRGRVVLSGSFAGTGGRALSAGTPVLDAEPLTADVNALLAELPTRPG